MSRCAALMPELRSVPPPSESSRSAEIPAARRRTAPRTRIADMTKNATVAAGMKTSAITSTLGLTPYVDAMSSSVSIASDLEVDHLVHGEVAHHHPADRHAEGHLGDVVLPHAAVEVGRDELDHAEQQDRQRREDQRRGASFGGERLDLATHLEPRADDRREVAEDLAEIAAGRRLDRHRGDEQRQVVLPETGIEVAHGGLEIGAVGDLVADEAELGADRIRHFARHH